MALQETHRHWLNLALVPGIGTAHFIRLLARFHTPEAVLRAPEKALAELVGGRLAGRIVQYRDATDVDRQEQLLAKWDAHIVTLDDPEYPLRLAEIHDPPLVLFVRGALTEADERSVAIVGTRRATPYGLRMAETLGRELARRGVTVVSGLAAGVDAAAHRGAIQGGGRTLAVLGSGVDIVYPKQNEDLFGAVREHGALLSQFPIGAPPSRGSFPYRNRIISGLTMGTVIVEAPLSSGALITARQAAEQGREVFAVPGHAGSREAEGPHALIREGATLVETVDDILAELCPGETPAPPARPEREAPSRRAEAPGSPPERSSSSSLNAPSATAAAGPRDRRDTAAPQAPARQMTPPDDEKERKILESLDANGSYVDEIAAACRIPVSDALSALTMLELKGFVRQFGGKRFAPR